MKVWECYCVGSTIDAVDIITNKDVARRSHCILNFGLQDSGASSSSHGDWQHRDLQVAFRAVLMYNVSKKKAAAMYGIPRSTLQRYIKICKVDGGVEKKERGRQTTLSKEHESELCSIILDMERRLYGLRPQAVRKIVYQYCVKNNIPHTFCNEEKSAGKKWLRLFLGRHPELCIRIVVDDESNPQTADADVTNENEPMAINLLQSQSQVVVTGQSNHEDVEAVVATESGSTTVALLEPSSHQPG